ncbi:MAG: DUF1365 domain-containing protein [Dehalococcoidia bacterium]
MSDGGALRSRLLRGQVRHRRGRHTDYDFTHSAWYLELDLDEVEVAGRRLRLLSTSGRHLLEFRARDHLDGSGRPLAEAVRARLRGLGYAPAEWRIALVTYPRVLGFVFNPVSFYLCRDEAGALRHVIAEVNNTHGEREVYDFPRDPAHQGSVYRSHATKRMYVSPFIEADARYELRVLDEPERLQISITEYEGSEQTLFARMLLGRRALTDGELAQALARDPLVTLKTIVLIGWHALRLRIRGVRWQRHRPRARKAAPIEETPAR